MNGPWNPCKGDEEREKVTTSPIFGILQTDTDLDRGCTCIPPLMFISPFLHEYACTILLASPLHFGFPAGILF
jgi:hypothetical protein